MTDVWQQAPFDLKLSHDHIDVWRTRLNLPKNEIAKYHALLSTDEVKRANRYKVKHKRCEYIVTRGLLRTILGQTLGRDSKSFVFEYAKHDKPFLPIETSGTPVSFNVSHSHNQALIAVTLDRTIGIDIEYIRHDVEFKKLAKRFFSDQEYQQLDAYDETKLSAAFFACWTRKEAFVKALGDGIAFGLSEFSVSVDPEDDEIPLSTHLDQAQASKWILMNIKTDEDYIAALAVDKYNLKIRCWDQEQ